MLNLPEPWFVMTWFDGARTNPHQIACWLDEEHTLMLHVIAPDQFNNWRCGWSGRNGQIELSDISRYDLTPQAWCAARRAAVQLVKNWTLKELSAKQALLEKLNQI